MNPTRLLGALASVVLLACVDSSQPLAPPRPRTTSLAVAPQAATARPLAYVAEVPNATQWYHPVHVADMNGDGRPEILIGGWGSHNIEIWRYDAALAKAVLWQTIVGLPYDINGIGTGDFDKDGDVDVVAAVRFYGTFLCRNDGGGSWTVTNLDPNYAWNVQVADLDGDGNLDVVGSKDFAGVVLLYGDGAGAFTAGAAPAITGSMSVNVADFNADGLPDLIGPDFLDDRMIAFENLGGRTWSANIGPTGTHPYQLVSEITPSALDLYGNGNLDQVAAYHASSGYTPPMTLVIFEGTGAPGSPSWSMRTLDELPYRGLPVGAADLDDDGHLDIFVGGSSGALGFRAYRGDGQGDFTAAETVPYTYGVGSRNSFSVVDFNGDGTSDIIATRHTLGVYDPSQGFVILYRTPVLSCAGFEAPLNAGSITVKGKRVLPLKAQISGETGQTLATLVPAPTVRVMFAPAGGGDAVDVSPSGAFAYIDGKWRYDLKTADFTAAGSYTVSMLSADATKYLVQPTCTATFVIN